MTRTISLLPYSLILATSLAFGMPQKPRPSDDHNDSDKATQTARPPQQSTDDGLDATDLMKSVRLDFEARQAMQQAQIASLRAKLAVLEKRVRVNERFKEQMIAQRVQTLKKAKAGAQRSNDPFAQPPLGYAQTSDIFGASSEQGNDPRENPSPNSRVGASVRILRTPSEFAQRADELRALSSDVANGIRRGVPDPDEQMKLLYREYRLQLELLKEAVSEAEALAEFSKKNLERITQLVKKGAVSISEADKSKLEVVLAIRNLNELQSLRGAYDTRILRDKFLQDEFLQDKIQPKQ